MITLSEIPPQFETFKPRLTASARPGYVRLSFDSLEGLSMKVQGRLRGEEWRTLIEGDTFRAVDDCTPNEVPGSPELREYRAVPTFDGMEIGEPSEIVSVSIAA
jgi:hypothetical protein